MRICYVVSSHYYPAVNELNLCVCISHTPHSSSYSTGSYLIIIIIIILFAFSISPLTVPNSIFLQTLKMQVYFMDHTIDKNQIIGRYCERLMLKTQPLTRDIINNVLHSKHDDNKYFKKIATQIIVHFSLGNPVKTEVSDKTGRKKTFNFICHLTRARERVINIPLPTKKLHHHISLFCFPLMLLALCYYLGILTVVALCCGCNHLKPKMC